MRKRSGTLALVAVGVIAAAAGLFVSVGRDVPDSTAGAAAPGAEAVAGEIAPDEAADLERIQAKLENTLVLPADFRKVPDFTLQGTDGEPLDQSFLDGRWTLAFFGYTHCPDVCPITLTVMRDVVDELESRDVQPMQVAFFTVDPKRDTAERMREYVGFFDPDFVGVTGELNDVMGLTRELGIVAAFTANDEEPENYVVDHTASMLLIDPERRVRAKFNAPHEVKSIVDDYLALMAELN